MWLLMQSVGGHRSAGASPHQRKCRLCPRLRDELAPCRALPCTSEKGAECSGGKQALFLIVASRDGVLGKAEEGCVLGRRCRPNRRASSESRNRVEFEVISYPCRGGASRVVSAVDGLRQSHHGHLKEAILFRQRRERALGRRPGAGRELRGADGRHVVVVGWWEMKGVNARSQFSRVE